MVLPFIDYGAEEIDASVKRSATNTNRFLSPNSKEPVRIVPLVEFQSNGTDDKTIVSYVAHKIWWNADGVKALKADMEAKGDPNANNVKQVTEFPMLSTDPEIDPGMWLANNPEAIANANVEVSTRYRKEGDPTIDKSRVYMFPVLWLNDPDLDGNPPFEVKMFKFTQATVYDGLKGYYAQTGMFAGYEYSIMKDDKVNRYNVMRLSEYGGFIPELDIKAEEMISMTTRDEQVERLALYGIEVPPVPSAKAHIVEAMQGKKEEPEVVEDGGDDWEEEE